MYVCMYKCMYYVCLFFVLGTDLNSNGSNGSSDVDDNDDDDDDSFLSLQGTIRDHPLVFTVYAKNWER